MRDKSGFERYLEFDIYFINYIYFSLQTKSLSFLVYSDCQVHIPTARKQLPSQLAKCSTTCVTVDMMGSHVATTDVSILNGVCANLVPSVTSEYQSGYYIVRINMPPMVCGSDHTASAAICKYTVLKVSIRTRRSGIKGTKAASCDIQNLNSYNH